MDSIWNDMYSAAKAVQNERAISDYVEAGGVAAAVLSASGKIYTGVCVDTACTLGICAERNAIFSMITAGEQEISRVIAIGGDGTFRGAKDLSDNFGIKCMGVPGTIDNDLAYTDYTIGFDTAVNTVLGAINNLRDTMQSHDRVSLVEVMGRHCGDIALYASIAGGAEYVLVPERPYDLDEIAKSLIKSKLRGKTSNMIVLAEGAGNRDEIISYLNEKAGVDIKKTHLGHVQRGGSPSMADRILATRFALKAVEELRNDKSVSSAIGIKNNIVQAFPFEQALACKKELDESLYEAINVLSR